MDLGRHIIGADNRRVQQRGVHDRHPSGIVSAAPVDLQQLRECRYRRRNDS